jgi:GDP/UDP-N,N'-diacetylbacillosamine 2-epimerase (hydrolysing)
LGALDGLDETALIFTKSNADLGGGRINQMIDNYVSKNSGRAVAFASLGQIRYLSAMRWVDGVIGNSSSGIIEAPSFKVGTINIGDRQKGRLKPDSIIDCKSERADILLAIKRLYSKQFQGRLKKVVNPYGDGNAAKRIKTVLKKWPLDNILKKDFYNIN